MRRRVITRVTTSVHSCLTAKTSSGTEFLYPSAITGGPVTACRCPVRRIFAIRSATYSFRYAVCAHKHTHFASAAQTSSAMPLRSHLPSAPAHPSQSQNSLCKVLRGFPCSVVYTCTLFFHEFSIWENRNTFPVVCKRGILIYNAHVITFSAVCTSNARPSEMQWSSASYPPPYSPQKGSYKSHPSENSPSPSSTSSSSSGKAQLPESAES